MNAIFHPLQCRASSSVIIFLLLAVCSFQSAQAAAGLLLYTAGGSPYVSAVQYETFSSPSAHLSYVTVKGGQKVQVRSDGIIANIPYPTSGAAVEQDEASGWIAQADMFAGRYPQYSTLLKSIGELWKRKLETAKVEQVSAPVTSTGSSSQPKSTGVQAPKSEIAVLKTKSGQIFKKVTITRFDGNNAIINYAEGVGRVPLSDFGDMSGLPSDVKMAIEKVTAAINEGKNKVEAERIAKEEEESAAKEAEEQRLARLKQDQLERAEQSKKTQEVLAHLAVAEQERLANEKREQERLAINNTNATTRTQETKSNEVSDIEIINNVARENEVDFKSKAAMYNLVKQTVLSQNEPSDEITNNMYKDALKNMEFSLKNADSTKTDLWVNGFVTLLAMSAKGHSKASLEIGRLYDQGVGVRKDPEMALTWMRKAEKQGSKRAHEMLSENKQNGSRIAQPSMSTNESSASPAQRNVTTINSGEAMSAYRREQLRKLNSPEYRKHLIEEATRSARGDPATALMSEKSIENMVDKSIADTNRMAQLMTDEEIRRQGGL